MRLRLLVLVPLLVVGPVRPAPTQARVESPVGATSAEAEPPPGLIDLAALAPGITIEMRYAGPHNFVGRPVHGYGAARCLLSRPAALALARVARDVARRGFGLLVYDCFRPQRAVADFVAWAGDGDLSTRDRHYPAISKDQLFSRGYIAARSGHSRGSTVDLTLIRLGHAARSSNAEAATAPAVEEEPSDCRVGAKQAPAGQVSQDIDMGTSFDCFDERAHVDSPGLSPAVRRHRRLLRQAMRRRGFSPYDKEWWHFTLAAEPFPDRYFDFEIR